MVGHLPPSVSLGTIWIHEDETRILAASFLISSSCLLESSPLYEPEETEASDRYDLLDLCLNGPEEKLEEGDSGDARAPCARRVLTLWGYFWWTSEKSMGVMLAKLRGCFRQIRDQSQLLPSRAKLS